MFDYYEVFDEFGASPATPEEWEHMRTGQDMVWMYHVTSNFTERLMQSYMQNHKDAKVMANEMDLFIEELQRQTGLRPEETGIAAHLGHVIAVDREFRDDPEGARQFAREGYESSLEREQQIDDDLENDSVNQDIRALAEDMAQMLEERHAKKRQMDAELGRMEYLMASTELDKVFQAFDSIFGTNDKEEKK